MNRPSLNIARVSGEAFDADQIEHDDDDGFPTDWELWSKCAAACRAPLDTVAVADLGDGRSAVAA